MTSESSYAAHFASLSRALDILREIHAALAAEFPQAVRLDDDQWSEAINRALYGLWESRRRVELAIRSLARAQIVHKELR